MSIARPKHRASFLSLAALAALSACSGGDSNPGEPEFVTISGTILGPGYSATGATVELTSGTRSYLGSVDLSGEYRISGIAEGVYELVIDGSTVMEPDGSRVHELATLRIDQFSVVPGAMPFGTSVLTLPEVGASLQLELDEFGQGVVLAGTELAMPDGGPALRFVRSAVVTFPEGSNGTLSICETRPEAAVAAFQSEVNSPVGGLLIQPQGVSFDFPPTLLLPNRGGLAPNTTGVEILGLGPDGTGVTVVGTGTVDPDGRYILPDAGASLAESRGAAEESNFFRAMMIARFPHLYPSGTVTGTLKDTSGADLTDVRVIVQGADTRQLTASGSFTSGIRLTGSDARVNVTAVGAGHLRGFGTASGYQNQAVNVDLVLEPMTDVPGAPTVVSSAPADDATDVPLRSIIRVNFNEFMDPGSFHSGLAVVPSSRFQGDNGRFDFGGRVRGEPFIQAGPSGSVVGFVLDQPLEAQTEYAILGTSDLLDAFGTRFTPEAPIVISVPPPNYSVIARFTTEAEDSGPVIGVNTSPNTATTIERHETLQAYASVTEIATSFALPNTRPTWASSHPSVATISSNGLIQPRGAGTTTITASAAGESAQFDLTVNPPAIDRIDLSIASDAAIIGRSLLATAVPYHASDSAFEGLPLTWASSNEGIATVNAFGQIETLAAGTTEISVHVTGDTVTATRTIHVYQLNEIDDVELAAGLRAVDVGYFGTLESRVYAGSSEVFGLPVTYASSNPAALTIGSSGTSFEAVAEGVTVLTATVELGATDLTRDFTVTVFPAGSSSVKVLGGGKATDPAVGELVIRHDATSGAFAEAIETDSMGVASFETLASSTMSFSTAEVAGNTTRLRSYFGVPRSMTTISGGRASGDPVIQLNASNVPQGTDLISGSAGRFAFPEDLVGPAQPASLLGVSLGQLQDDGLVSAFVAVQDSPSDPVWEAPSDVPSAAGFLLDADPALLNGTMQTISVSSGALTMIPFGLTVPTYSFAPAGGVVRRSGVLFSQRFGVGFENIVGHSTLALPTGWDAAFVVHQMSGAFTTRQYTTFTSVPSTSVQVSPRDLRLSDVAWAGGSLSWTLAGADASTLDIGRAKVAYTTLTGKRVDWTAWFDPSATSVSVPGLPTSMSDVRTSYDLIEYELELFALENVSGYPAAIQAISASNGSLEQAMLDGGIDAHSVTVESNAGGGGTGGSTDWNLSFTIDIFGTGTVTADTGSGPMTVTDGQTLVIPDGTSVTVTATGTNGSVVVYMETPGDFFFDGNPSETSTFTMDADGTVTVEIQ
ncbi:Bacterial Ig-like domain (group 2) [Planctomycetes bacterium Poly30]|uniref:Bacterial Ig-like domain (Group 2) n=1 Tax=Saltatorellus ferox TaxID=2528018 RepID=A0A518ENB8_9BACT|nr:Bacterial Ig-like domain (group 2) [Planctomycetes bacterium Poly30]